MVHLAAARVSLSLSSGCREVEKEAQGVSKQIKPAQSSLERAQKRVEQATLQVQTLVALGLMSCICLAPCARQGARTGTRGPPGAAVGQLQCPRA